MKYLPLLLLPLTALAGTVPIGGHNFAVEEVSPEQIDAFFANIESRISPIDFDFAYVTKDGAVYYLFDLPQHLSQAEFADELLADYRATTAYYRRHEPETAQLLTALLAAISDSRSSAPIIQQYQRKHIKSPNRNRHSDALSKAIIYVQNKEHQQKGGTLSAPRIDPLPSLPLPLNAEDFYTEFRSKYLNGSLDALWQIKPTDNLYTRIIGYSDYIPPGYVFDLLPPDQQRDLTDYFNALFKYHETEEKLAALAQELYRVIHERHASRHFTDVYLLAPIYLYVLPSSHQEKVLDVVSYFNRAAKLDEHITQKLLYGTPPELKKEVFYIIENSYLSPATASSLSATFR